MHFPGADLDFDRMTTLVDDLGVEALVAVGFGLTDVIKIHGLDRHKKIVHHADSDIAIVFGFGDDPEGEQVVNLFELQLLLNHLVKD